jgi:hypothetical protein
MSNIFSMRGEYGIYARNYNKRKEEFSISKQDVSALAFSKVIVAL